METNGTTQTQLTLTVKALLSQDKVKEKFVELLGKKAQGFITSVLQCVASNNLLTKAEPHSVYHAAMVAATLDLPLNNALGFAYIVPYNQKQPDGSYKTIAQFQAGYKSFIQLAQRSGQFKTISAAPIFEGQLVESNPLIGYRFDFTKKTSEKIIGYAAYFQLLNGFEKTFYMTVAELQKHGKKYSQTFKKGFGLWETDFDAMAIKTVIKLLLSKFAPLSVEMQKVVMTDQGLIHDVDATDVTYPDNEEPEPVDKPRERVELLLKDVNTLDELRELSAQIPPEHHDLYEAKKKELIPSEPFTVEVSHDIVTCETVAQVNEIYAKYPKLHKNPDFEKVINAQKLLIGKKLKGAKV